MSLTEPRDVPRVDPRKRVGQVGEGWGNLLLPEGEMERDQEFLFQGDERPFWITRVLTYPLDTRKQLYYYERVPRWKHPPPAPSPR